MLGVCFADKEGCHMLDLGIRQIRKGLGLPGLSAGDSTELHTQLQRLLQRRAR
jgi:hypothetical protein